jgi:hypothetical protein
MLKLRHVVKYRVASISPFPQSPIAHRVTNLSSLARMASEWRRVEPLGSIPPFFIFGKPIQKSEQDDRDYRIIKLENGLHATLVHDPQTDSAAASLDVSVGHLSDPVSSSIHHHFLMSCRISRMICPVLHTFANICYLWLDLPQCCFLKSDLLIPLRC